LRALNQFKMSGLCLRKVAANFLNGGSRERMAMVVHRPRKLHPRSKTGRGPRCGAEIHPPGIAVLAGNEHVEEGQSFDHGNEGYHRRRVAKRLGRG